MVDIHVSGLNVGEAACEIADGFSYLFLKRCKPSGTFNEFSCRSSHHAFPVDLSPQGQEQESSANSKSVHG